MKSLTLHLFLLLLVGCSIGITVHDENRAAELIVDFLSALKSSEGIHLSYEWTDNKYKEEVTFDEFSQIVASIRGQNQGADIRLTGYETFGADEAIVVYADSDIDTGKMYFRFGLVGTKPKDYYLLNLTINDSEFDKTGINKDYDQTIVIQGV
ncbi:MAG: hypothetical protein GY785_22985 [Gammaproteobacteria bacterium]|nr:hypothetical protein [Gammaproteobacteria bacterium]